MDEDKDIIQEYFEQMSQCHLLDCQKVIFDPDERQEYFFEDDSWSYFKFYCQDDYYTLKKDDGKIFENNCYIKEMSYEIKMLLAYMRLRNVTSIEKQMFSDYVNRFEQEKLTTPTMTLEKFNVILKEQEDTALKKADRIANGIMGGCLVIAISVFLLFAYAIFTYFRAKFFA